MKAVDTSWTHAAGLVTDYLEGQDAHQEGRADRQDQETMMFSSP